VILVAVAVIWNSFSTLFNPQHAEQGTKIAKEHCQFFKERFDNFFIKLLLFLFLLAF
jgi:hypothetical protein